MVSEKMEGEFITAVVDATFEGITDTLIETVKSEKKPSGL